MVATPPCRDARGRVNMTLENSSDAHTDVTFFGVVFVFFGFIFYCFGALKVRRSSSVCESNAGADGAAAESSSNTSLGPSHQTKTLGESKSNTDDETSSIPPHPEEEEKWVRPTILYVGSRDMKASPAGPSRS